MIWEVGDGLPLVQADHHSLLQVFVNLARNSRAGAGILRTAARCASPAAVESDLVVVRFRDTGPGRGPPRRTVPAVSAGRALLRAGLYISRAILRSHGGGLRYEPEGRGSCFTVELWPVENTVEG